MPGGSSPRGRGVRPAVLCRAVGGFGGPDGARSRGLAGGTRAVNRQGGRRLGPGGRGHPDDRIGVVDEAAVVADHDDGCLAGQGRQHGAHARGIRPVEVRGRLVEEGGGGAGSHPQRRARDREPPCLARAQLRGTTIAQRGQAELIEHGVHGGQVVGDELELVVQGRGEEPRGLRRRAPDEPDRPPWTLPVSSASGSRMPASAPSSVDLPAPLGPTTTDRCPCRNVAENPWTAAPPRDGVAHGEVGHTTTSGPPMAIGRTARGRQQLGDPPQRGGAVLRGVERGTHLAERREALGREQQHEQRRSRAARRRSTSRMPSSTATTATESVRDQFEHERRQERGAQRGHGAPPVSSTGCPRRASVCSSTRPSPTSTGRPCASSTRWSARRCEGAGCRVRALAGVHPDQHHEHGHERHGDDDHDRAQPVREEDARAEHQRNDRGRHDAGMTEP